MNVKPMFLQKTTKTFVRQISVFLQYLIMSISCLYIDR